MVRFQYVITINDDSNPRVFNASTVQEAYDILKREYPDKLTVRLRTFKTYMAQKKGPFFTVEEQEYVRKSQVEYNQDYRSRKNNELEQLRTIVNEQQEKISLLEEQILQLTQQLQSHQDTIA